MYDIMDCSRRQREGNILNVKVHEIAARLNITWNVALNVHEVKSVHLNNEQYLEFPVIWHVDDWQRPSTFHA